MFARLARRACARAAAGFPPPTAAAGRAIGSKTTGLGDVAPEVLDKARKMAPPVGLAAGLFGSMVGVGGGVIIVPAITSAAAPIPQRIVSGTSLAAVVSTALASSAVFAQGGCVDVAAAALIAPAAMLTAPLGARLASRLDCNALRRILGYFLIVVAPLVPLKSQLLSGRAAPAAPAAEANAEAGQRPSITAAAADKDPLSFLARQVAAIEAMGAPTAALFLGAGAAAGVLSGLLGIGGGTVVTPLLALAMPHDHQATVLGTSLLAMAPPAAVGLAAHARLGNVDWRMAAGLAAGTAVGAAVGSTAAIQTPSAALEALFAVGMLFLGRKTLQSTRKYT